MNEITVVKCGGTAGVDRAALCADLAALVRAGERPVLVHGGSADIERLAGRLGVPQRRLTTPSGSSSRYTDAATLEVLLLALAGAVKPDLLAELARHGVPATGLTGVDAGLLRARRTGAYRAVLDGRPVVIRDDRTGRITEARPAVLHTLLSAGIVPVVSPPALGDDGEVLNVDADRAAAAIAVALHADRLIFLTGAPGVLADPDDETSVLPIAYADAPPAAAGGGMTAKLQAARRALDGGVGRVIIADGRRAEPVTAALAGAGTEVRRTPTTTATTIAPPMAVRS